MILLLVKKELDVVAAIAPQANQHYMCMRSGLKVAFACMSQDGEGVLSIKFNVIVNGVASRSLVLVYGGTFPSTQVQVKRL